VLAYQSGFEKERKVRRYLERHEFKFTTLLKEDERAESPFGMKVAGSALLIGPGEIRRALEAAVPAK